MRGLYPYVTSTSLILIICLTSVVHTAYTYEGKQIFHVTTTRQMLTQLRDDFTHVDVWQARPSIKPVVVVKDPEVDENPDNGLIDLTLYTTSETMAQVMRHSQENRAIWSVQPELRLDMDQLIQTEKTVTAECHAATAGYLTARLPSKPTTSPFFECFRRAEDIEAFLNVLVMAYPNLLSKFPISTTVEGATIYGYQLQRAGARAGQQALYLEGMLHAREWLGPATIVYLMTSLLEGGRAAKRLLSSTTFYFVPIVNLDGYAYTWETNRMWRKNRRKNDRSFWDGQTYGVDLNRNFGPESSHCGPGASKKAGSDVYCGPHPLSEPELIGIDAFLSSHPEIIGAMDIHCFGNMILRPYSNTFETLAEPAKGQMEALGERMRVEMNGMAKGSFVNIRGSNLYVASGTFLDYYYQMHEAKPSITLELRGGNFIVDAKLIRISGEEVFKGLQMFGEECAAY